MKNLSFLLSLFFAFTSFNINAQWEDDFSDGNLHQNPAWFGDTSYFIINQERLELDADSAGSVFLYTGYDLFDTDTLEWSFEVDIDFSPSQNNGFKYILFSSDSLYWESDGLENSLCYYLKFGEIGSLDAVELYRKDSTQADPILLCRGIDALISSSFHRKYKVFHHASNWAIYSALYNSPYFILEAETLEESENISSGYLGLDLYYTSSNIHNFAFDAISIDQFYEDLNAAFYTDRTVINDHILQVDFSEALDSSVLNSINYFLIEMGTNPVDVGFLNSEQTSIVLDFESAFIEYTTLNLEIINIKDIAGNSSADMTLSFAFNPEYEAQLREIQFSEILADPNPPLGLPNAEFIELYNASDSIINLENYILANSGTERYLAEYHLLPNSFLILCKESDADLFSVYGDVEGVEGWVGLLNTGDSLLLKNKSGILLDRLYYDITWYDSSLKKEGGWSLEKLSYENSCYGESNWKESDNINGGTPGVSNSVLGEEIDMDVFIGQVFIVDSNSIKMEMEGELDLVELPATMISTSPPFEIDWDLSIIEESGIHLYCTPPFKEEKKYHLRWHNLKSCDGDIIDSEEKIFAFAEEAINGDVVFNEVLFNPYTGANDFIEIINRSDKYVDLKSWRINLYEDGNLLEDAQISSSTLIISPNEILAFSKNVEELPILYPTSSKEQLWNINDLPNLKDDSGKLVLVDQNFERIDSVEYKEDMHFPLIEDVNGVSLERVHPDRGSGEVSSWASASERIGYASPGLPNSQLWEGGNQSLDLKIEPELFTPNNDGDKDYMFIHYNLKEGGWQAKVNIYSKDGIEVRTLVENDWVSGKGVFKWNGLDNNDELLSVGIYVVYFEAFNRNGEVLVFKKACVIADVL